MRVDVIGVAGRFALYAVVSFSFVAAAREKRVNISCDHVPDSEYRAFAELCKSLGATHVSACEVEDSLWQWDAAMNRKDPYPNWSMHRPTLLKFVTPEPLKPYFPEAYTRRNRVALEKRAAILKELGLKAQFDGMEPMYWPEQAFRDHPSWRGARVDQARRARQEYFSPCLDNPEVRAMYVAAVAELCRICPFESFQLMTNDSGSGLCWHSGLYPGQNGPVACQPRAMADRVVDYLSIFQEGAAQCGLTATVDARKFAEADLPAILAKLRPGQSILNETATSKAAVNIIGFTTLTMDKTFPIACLPRMGWLAEQLQQAQRQPTADDRICLRALDEVDTLALLKRYLHQPIGEGPAARYAALEKVAAEFVGAADAPALVRVWELIERAVAVLEPMRTGGAHLMVTGNVHQRWLTRPFVPFPAELTAEEKDYWHNFQMQAQTDADSYCVVDIEANRIFSGVCAVRLAAVRVIVSVNQNIDGALKELSRVKGVDAAGARYVEATALKLRLFRAMVMTISHAIKFQFIMDETDFTKPPKDTTLFCSWQGDQRLNDVNMIVREEIGNTHEIIGLLETAEQKGLRILRTCDDAKFETVMNLPPPAKLIGDLRKKVEIMENHRRDFLRLYRPLNR